MSTLSIQSQRNIALESVKFTPNSLVLLKHTITTSASGDVNTNIKYLEFPNLVTGDVSDLSLLCSLVSWQLAELNWNTAFDTEFNETGITNRKIFTPFLNTDTLYRVDEHGTLQKALISAVPLNQTALKVTRAHKVVGCKPELYKKLVERHCKAILKQFTKLVAIEGEALNLGALLNVPAKGKGKNKPATAPVEVVETPKVA